MDDDLKAALDRLAQGQERLEQRQERLEQGQERLEQGQGELRTTMMERFERVEDKLTSLFEDVSVNMMAVTRQHDLRAAERADVEQLIKLVLRMEVQILRLRTDVDELKKAS